VATPPAKCYLAESFAEFSDETRIENGVMTTTRELVIKKSEIPLSDWEGFHKFGRAVSDDEFDFMPLTQTEAVIADKSTQQADQVGEQDVDALFDRGRDALQRRDGQRAQELFEKVIAKDPKRRGAHLNLGIALMRQNSPTDAVAEFHKEQEISPNDPQSFQLAAAAAGFTGNNFEAAAELRKLLSVDPRDAGAATTLGGLLSEQGKYPEAVEVLEAAVKATPDSPGLQFQLGTAHLQAGHSV